MKNGLLFITQQTERYSHLRSVEIALAGGCRQIQLRMKEAPAGEVEEVAFRAKALCDKFNAALYVDDHVEVCRRVNLRGVHLGKSDMPPPEARNILGNQYIIGGTANTFEDIEVLYRRQVDYIGLGPFRFTTTKKNLSPLLGLEGYRRIIGQCRDHGINLPIVAIGGITAEDIPDLMQTGVSAIALSGAILNAEDPVAETRKIVKQIKRHSIWKT
ncbi:MAG: thiamine phosphate synthase [Tannerella sp.]|nr:thiamine phosphate synthase [Tannerella sp.]